MSNVFLEVLHISWITCPFIVVMLLINKFAAKRYSIKWIQFLWILVALRLFVPVNAVQITLPEKAGQFTQIVQRMKQSTDADSIRDRQNSRDSRIEENTNLADDNSTVLVNQVQSPMDSSNVILPSRKVSSLFTVLRGLEKCFCLIWLTGLAGFLIKHLLSYLIFYKRLMGQNMLVKEGTCFGEYLTVFKRINKKKRHISVYVNSYVPAPFSMGVIHKAIVLPDKHYQEEELEAILHHEYTHILNHDIGIKVLLCAASAVHWFNPLVYCMERAMNQNMELICDQEVVQGSRPEYRKMYGMTILNTLLDINEASAVTFVTHFEGEKKQVKERFRNIMKSNYSKKVPVMIALIGVLCIGASFIKCHVVSGNSKENPAVTATLKKADPLPEKLKDPVTILVSGEEKTNDDKARADSIVLVTWNPVKRDLNIHNLCRELYVEIPGTGKDKLGAAYYLGGKDLLKETVEKNFNVSIDYNVAVNYASFEKVVDCIGGVRVPVSKKEAEFLNRTNYISKKKNRNLIDGMVQLNGNQALGYARVRYVSSSDGQQGDFGRMKRLQNIFQSMLEKLDDLKLTEYTALIKEGMTCLDGSMSFSQCLALASSLEEAKYTVTTGRIPMDESYTPKQTGNKFVLEWDKERNLQALQ